MSSVATSMPQGKSFVDETDPICLRFLKSLQKEKESCLHLSAFETVNPILHDARYPTQDLAIARQVLHKH